MVGMTQVVKKNDLEYRGSEVLGIVVFPPKGALDGFKQESWCLVCMFCPLASKLQWYRARSTALGRTKL